MADQIRTNPETGDIEVFNDKGEKIGTQSRKKGSNKKNRKTATIDVTPKIRSKAVINVLDSGTKKRVLDYALEGKTITAIAGEIGRSKRVLYTWLASHHEFRAEFEGRRKVAAYRFEEQMEDLVEKTSKKSHVTVNKFKFDALKQLGEISNPARFGKKTTLEGNSDKPLKIIFDTGIDRSPVGPKDIESTVKKIDEKDS